MVTDGQRNALFQTLYSGSIDVSDRLHDGQLHGVEPGEETLTDNLLLAMKRSQPNINVAKFTRTDESRRTGADWEWWWEGEREWFGAVVQAKKLLPITGGASGYAFGYRAKKSKRRQIDVLLEYSEASGLPGLYALYNGPGLDLSTVSDGVCTHMDPRMWGVTVLPAPVAAYLLALKQCSQAAVNPVARPLACQLCSGTQDCQGAWCDDAHDFSPADLGFSAAVSESDPAYLAAEAMLIALDRATMGGTTRTMSGSAEPREPLAVEYVRSGVRTPPDYVARVVERGGYSELVAESNEPVSMAMSKSSLVARKGPRGGE